MSHRIDVELTSQRDDGTWTWRAAGARQPKGLLNGALLPEGAVVGDVLRAEADFEVEGISIISVTAPKSARNRAEPERLEILGSRPSAPDVTTTLVPGRKRRDWDDEGGERRGRGGDRGARPGERSGRDADRRGPRREGDRGRSERPAGERGPRDRQRPERPAPPARPRPKRLRPTRTHRQAFVNQLPAEQRPLAEIVLRGGVPLVRETLDNQRKAAEASGLPTVKPGPVLDVAEKLVPHARLAEWQDRAAAALAQADDVDLRDLRSVVVAADGVARHEQTRETAEQLRTALTRRVEAEHATWLAEIGELLDAGRSVNALRLSSRPPKAGVPLPPPLATRLAEATTSHLTERTAPDLYAALIEALALSPVRLQVTPAGVPSNPSDALVQTVRRLGDRLPQVAAAFGVEPTPPSRRPGGRGGPRRGPRPGSAGGPPKADAGQTPAGPEATPAPEATTASTPETAPEVPPVTAPEATPESRPDPQPPTS
jgi:hypothetical protein